MGGVDSAFSDAVEPTLKYHPCYVSHLTAALESGRRTVLGGQFDWGGLLQKGNGGVQRYTQYGWQSCIEHKGKSMLNCETDQVEQVRKQDLVIRWFRVEGPSLIGQKVLRG